MDSAIDTLALAEEDARLLRDYVERGCRYLINADE